MNINTFSGTIGVEDHGYNYEYYEIYHNIVSEFKHKYDLSIIDIENKDRELIYRFIRKYIKEDDIRYELDDVTITFKKIRDIIRVTLVTKTCTFDKFVYKYRDLKDICNKNNKINI